MVPDCIYAECWVQITQFQQQIFEILKRSCIAVLFATPNDNPDNRFLYRSMGHKHSPKILYY